MLIAPTEICHRLQTARPAITKGLLYYLLPWLYNMELVDPNVANCNNNAEGDNNNKKGDGNSSSNGNNTAPAREGWGTAEATEMITNNLFYITVKVRDRLLCVIESN